MDLYSLSYAMEMMAVSSDTESLAHDVDIIVECSQLSSEHNMMHDIPFEVCKLKRGIYADQERLYIDIVHVMRDKNISHLLMDIMPYIDDYIEYFTYT